MSDIAFCKVSVEIKVAMAPKLYYSPGSTSVRAVLMTADALGVKFDLHVVNLLKQEQLNPDYIKLNPQHTVPTLVDGDYILWDSHAINAYLVGKYGKDDSLYPKDVKKRGRVDQRLHFDSGVLFPAMARIVVPLKYQGSTYIEQVFVDKANETYGLLNAFLEQDEWIAGDQITIADFSVAATLSSLILVVPLDRDKYPKVAKWFAKMEVHPSYEVNRVGLQPMKELLDRLKR